MKKTILIMILVMMTVMFSSVTATVFDDNCTYKSQLNFTNPDAFDHDYEAFIDTHWDRSLNVIVNTNFSSPTMANVRLIQDDNEIPFNITGNAVGSVGVETILNISSSGETTTYLHYECDLPTADYSSCQTWDTCTPFINFFDDFDGSYDFSANGWLLESLYYTTYDDDIPNAINGVATLNTLDGMHKAIPIPINTSENNNRYTIEFLAKSTSATSTFSVLVATNDSIDSNRGHSYSYQIRIPATAWTMMMYQDGANGFSNFAQSSNASTNNVWYLYNGGREPDYTFFLRRNNSLLTNDVSDANDTRFTVFNYVGMASAVTSSIDYVLVSLNRVENFANPSIVNLVADTTPPLVSVSDNITGNVTTDSLVSFNVNVTDNVGVDYIIFEFNSSKYPAQNEPTILNQTNSSYPPYAQGFGSDGNNTVFYIQAPDGSNFYLYQRYLTDWSLVYPPCLLSTVTKAEDFAYNPLTGDLYVADLGTTDKIHVIDKTDCSSKYIIDYNYGSLTTGVSIWNNTLYVLPRTEVSSCPRTESEPLVAGDPTSNTIYYTFTNDDTNQLIQCSQGFEHQGDMYWVAFFNGTGGITVNNPDYYRLYGSDGDIISQLDFTTYEPEGVAFAKYNGEDIMMMNTNEGGGTSYLGLNGTYIMYWNLTHTVLNQTFDETSPAVTSREFKFQKAMIYGGDFAYRIHAVDTSGQINTTDWVSFTVGNATPCIPDWQLEDYWTDCDESNFTQQKGYIDQNECGEVNASFVERDCGVSSFTYGDSTNFNQVSDMTNIEGAVVETEYGYIKWNFAVNVEGYNLDDNIIITNNILSLDKTNLHPSMNSSADVQFRMTPRNNEEETCDFFLLYHSPDFFGSQKDLLKAIQEGKAKLVANKNDIGDDCKDDTICLNISCSNNLLQFTALQFSGFGIFPFQYGENDVAPAVINTIATFVITIGLLAGLITFVVVGSWSWKKVKPK